MSHSLDPETIVYDLKMAGDPQVSPDGSRIVYALTTGDRASQKQSTQLWLCGIDGAAPRRLTYSGERNRTARWAPDGRSIAFVSDRVQRSGLFLLPAAAPGEARELARHAADIADLAWSADGARLAYTVAVDPANPDGAEPPAGSAPAVRATRRLDYKQDGLGYLGDKRRQVFVLDVATGERRQLTSDASDHNAPQWSPDGRTLAVQIPSHNGLYSRLGLIDVGSGETKLAGAADGVVGVWAWSPDGSRILLTGEEGRTWQHDLYLYEVATGALRRLTNDLECQPDSGFPNVLPPSQPVWLDGKRALFHAFHQGASALYVVDVETGRVEREHAWHALNSGLSADAARRYVVQSFGSLETAGEISVIDRESGTGRVVTSHNAALLAEAPAAAWEHFEVERAGFTIEAWLLKPPGFDPAKRYPVVLDVHGGPNSHYGWGFVPWQQCLAGGGFVTVFCNPRGSATYGREFTSQVICDWGGEDYLDLQAVLDTVLANPWADPARTGIFGHSYGGYMTAWAVSQSPRFAAAVSSAPVFDLELFYGTADIGHVFGELQFGGAPCERVEWCAAHSPSAFAHKACTPTLILHGEADERCPIGQGEQLFVALKKAGCETEFVRYPGGSHTFIRNGPPAHRTDWLGRIVGWFQGHLGGAE